LNHALFFAHNNHFNKNETKKGGKGKRHWKVREKKLTCKIASLLSSKKQILP
jgi:hypothetical protein